MSHKHQANQGVRGTGRDPILSERVDLSHPASPPRRLSPPPRDEEVFSSETTDLVVRPSVDARTTAMSVVAYENAHLPVRSWEYAGRMHYHDSPARVDNSNMTEQKDTD